MLTFAYIFGVLAILSVVEGSRTRIWTQRVVAPGVQVKNGKPSNNQPIPTCGEDPRWAADSEQRTAIILRGETFRYDGTTNESESYRNIRDNVVLKGNYSTSFQLTATRSQLYNLIRPLEMEGKEVDVFTATYETPWHDQLNAEFGDRLKVDLLLSSEGYNQATSLLASLQSVLDYASERHIWYKSVFVVRHDLLLKQDLAKLASRHPDSLLFPFKLPNTKYLSDMIFTFPGRFFGCFYDSVSSESSPTHMKDIKDPEKYPKLVKIGTLIDGRYQTNPTRYSASEDPVKAGNPVYDVPGRPRSDRQSGKTTGHSG